MPEVTIAFDDRIDDVPALHTSPGSAIQLIRVVQEIDTDLVHHEAATSTTCWVAYFHAAPGLWGMSWFVHCALHFNI